MTQEAQVNPEEMAPIETIEQFGFLIGNWHRDISHHLLAVAENPDALGLKEEQADGTELQLTTREARCFALGVEYAISVFKDLPFKPVMEDADEADSENPGDGSIV